MKYQLESASHLSSRRKGAWLVITPSPYTGSSFAVGIFSDDGTSKFAFSGSFAECQNYCQRTWDVELCPELVKA